MVLSECVSGARRVGSVVFSAKRRLRIRFNPEVICK